MKPFTILLFILVSISCATTKKANAKLNPLSGTWLPIAQEISGKLLPTAVYEKQKLILGDSTYKVIAESVDKGIVKYHDNKMDIYGKDGVNAGKHFTAIYKYEQKTTDGKNEQLTICYNLTGNAYPESFDTKGKPMYFISVFRKEMNK